MSSLIYEASKTPRIQVKLHEEIDRHLNSAENGFNITYETLHEMEFLDSCVSETLRKHPPIPFLNRETTIDYKIPGTETIVQKGTSIIIPTYALHHDPNYFPCPDIFLPERFHEKNLHESSQQGIHYMPFGDGARFCIGRYSKDWI